MLQHGSELIASLAALSAMVWYLLPPEVRAAAKRALKNRT
jgi:hypothetical protein